MPAGRGIAVCLYLRVRGRGVNEEGAREAAKSLDLPLVLTKRGCLIFAYRG